MPILTISELVLNELSQMRFRFGGTPADVVEYEDGGRKASGQAISVEGLEAVTDSWVGYPVNEVPIADGNGMIPEFYGPQGIISLRVDFGHGAVVLRADASDLHKELRDILIVRLSDLQIDNDSFRTAVSGEIDAMRVQLDTAVQDALDEVADLIEQQQDSVIQQAVDDKLDTDLAPTLAAAVNDALANDVPPLITAEVSSQLPPAIAGEVSDLESEISDIQGEVDQQAVTLANTRYDLDATRSRVTSAENRLTAVETRATVSTWSRTVTFSDSVVTLRLQRIQSIVFATMHVASRTSNGGPTGFVARTGMGIPSQYIPNSDWGYTQARATYANGQILPEANYSIGVTNDGRIVTQGYAVWNELFGSLHWFV